MPFKPTSLPEQIRAANGPFREAVDAPRTSYNAGAAQSAKETAARWQQSQIRDPQRDSASAWFSGERPFSELVAANGQSFNDWSDRFRNSTDMGFNFAPPPPEPPPAASPAAPSSDAKPKESQP